MDFFSKNLFWDVDENDLNSEKHARFIIERVLMHGRMSDWFWVFIPLSIFDKKSLFYLDNIEILTVQMVKIIIRSEEFRGSDCVFSNVEKQYVCIK
jgi:hypothetical protein